MTHRSTLAALRRQLGTYTRGCPTCRHWHGSPLIAFDRDGTVTYRTELPTCPDCGRKVALRRERHITGVPAEMLEAMFRPSGCKA